MPRGVVSGEKRRGGGGEGKKRSGEKSAGEQRKRRTDRGREERAKTAANSNGSTTRGGSRAIVPSRVLYFSSRPSSSSSFTGRARGASGRGTVGFIVFELDASLFCFVSRAIRGANCRSYAIAFCFLLLPPFLHDPLSLTLFFLSLFRVAFQPSVHHHQHYHRLLSCSFARRAPRPTPPTTTPTAKEG